MIKNVIFNIKTIFNKEFEWFCTFRSKQLDAISEKNLKIKDILKELGKEVDIFIASPNLIEQPSEVLKVTNDEIKIQKYMTKEEKRKQEEERKAEEERLRKMNEDDAGQRALKQMMNNTLEEKKENPLTETQVREEWMDKPREQMNEEERAKYDEFLALEAKLNEEKEKIKKSLEQELRKTRSEISELCETFDKKLFILFLKRLEYQYRICEQELYIIKLSESILKEKKNIKKSFELELEIEKLEEKKRLQGEFIFQLENETKRLKGDKEKLDEMSTRAESLNVIRQALQPIYNQLADPIRLGNLFDNKWFEALAQKYHVYDKRLCELDPYYFIEREDIKKVRENDFETYQEEAMNNLKRRMAQEYDEQDYHKKLKNAFDCSRQQKEKDAEIKFLASFKDGALMDRDRIDEDLEFNKTLKMEKDAKMLKANSNIDVQIRFRRSIVEISMKKAIPELKDAIQISRSSIEEQNKDILEKGHKKVKALMDNIDNAI